MSNFLQGLQFGFVQGMMNNMFGGFYPFGFGSFGFSPFGFNAFGFSPFNIGMSFGMGMFSIPMMSSNSFSAPSIFMPTQTTWSMPMDSMYIMPSLITRTPETTAEFTDMFVPSPTINPLLGTENNVNETGLTDEERDKLEEEKEIREILTLHEKWSAKDISKDAELTPQFCDRVVDISNRIKCNPDDLMALIYSECRFNPAAENKANPSGNVGLIQFGEAALKDLGITKEQLLNMNSLDQLVYVEKYLVNCKNKLGYSDEDKIDIGTLAAMVFRPKYADKEILARKGSDAYRKNKPLDINKDGKITKTELADRLRSYQ